MLADARKAIEEGRLEDARRALDALRADPATGKGPALGEATLIGLPRKLHSAYLKLAKVERDVVTRVGLQHALVPDPAAIIDLFRFEAPDLRRMAALSAEPVPRTIHQIWVGDLPVPPGVERWRSHAEARGFAYRLWREADLAALGIDSHPSYRSMLELGDYPGVVDIARYAVLKAEGGIYVDCDWYPTRDDIGFDILLPMHGVAVMAEDIARETGYGSLLYANSLIAAPPDHPVFDRLLEAIPEVVARLPQAPAWWATGPLVVTMALRQVSTVVAPHDMVQTLLPRRAPEADVEAACAEASLTAQGLLILWKSW